MMADIESKFYQVRVPDTDADLLRFLWWPDGNLSAPLKEYRMAVHLFGATSSPSVASYALRRTAEDRKYMAAPEAVEAVLHNFYVDDCLKSAPTEDEAVALVKNLRDLCMKGDFNLTKWVSNSRKVLSSVPAENRATELKDLDLTHDNRPIERALDVQWCTEDDTFAYSIKLQDNPMTRRGILSVVNSIYDPLGFLVPVIFPAKLLLRNLCKEKRRWDDEVSGMQADQWSKWLEELIHLSDFSIRICVKPVGFGHTVEARLHHFSDASEHAYGTASYLVLVDEQGRTHCSFVMGKSRVAPLKQVTIPRLELTAAVVTVKVDKMLQEEMQLPLQQSIFWTDSMTVRYINSKTARFKTFVANRIALIQEATKSEQWKYVRTSDNPADQATRGMKVESLMQGETWINGPQFLLQPESEWPQRPDDATQDLQNDSEVKNITANRITAEEKSDPMNQLIQYYSSWGQIEESCCMDIARQGDIDPPERQKKRVPMFHQKSPLSNSTKPTIVSSVKEAEFEDLEVASRMSLAEVSESLMVEGGAAAVPGGDAASQDPLYGSPVEKLQSILESMLSLRSLQRKKSRCLADFVIKSV
ncbi:hypothetical protein L3Q82_017185 [Scortum barcoo]|uniref:Uncharacterized protein n=1 Tax=Scortum barcoo TaxID=214431 RepID=A0ACB8VLQ1_9TELE|nr:hypothetical protein L3Q82_017185 [Scortum barcoo]